MGRYRLILKQVSINSIDNNLATAKVVLTSQEKSYTGQATGSDEPESRLQLAVSATLEAITQALSRPIRFEISTVEVRELTPQKPRFVVVLLKTDYFIQPVGEAIELLGACQLTSSETDSAVRATLNATNRAISMLLK